MADAQPGMIAIVVEFEVPPQAQSAFEANLSEMVQETLAEDGCLRMEVFRPSGKPDTYVLNELWRDEEAIRVHRSQPGHDEKHAVRERMCSAKRVLRGVILTPG